MLLKVIISLITLENRSIIDNIIVHRKMHGRAARQSPDRQADGESFFFHSFNILIATAAVVASSRERRVTRSRFLFPTGIRWDPVPKSYFLRVSIHIRI